MRNQPPGATEASHTTKELLRSFCTTLKGPVREEDDGVQVEGRTTNRDSGGKYLSPSVPFPIWQVPCLL